MVRVQFSKRKGGIRLGPAYGKEVTSNAQVPETDSLFVRRVYPGNMCKLQEERGGPPRTRSGGWFRWAGPAWGRRTSLGMT